MLLIAFRLRSRWPHGIILGEMPNNKKKISFEDIQKRFLSEEAISESAGSTAPGSSASNEKLDLSHFDFDSSNPEAILIAGSSDSSSGCKSCAASAACSSDGGSSSGSSGSSGASDGCAGSGGAGDF